MGKPGLWKNDWAYEKESIPQVWGDLESFWMTYDANKIGAMWNKVEEVNSDEVRIHALADYILSVAP